MNIIQKLMAMPIILKMLIGLDIRCDADELKNILRAMNEAIFIVVG